MAGGARECRATAETDPPTTKEEVRYWRRRTGSLGTHLRKLEDAGYLAVDKTCRDRRPLTWYQLTAAGQQHLERHVENLTRLIDRAR